MLGQGVVGGAKVVGHGVVGGAKLVGRGAVGGTKMLGHGTVGLAKGIAHVAGRHVLPFVSDVLDKANLTGSDLIRAIQEMREDRLAHPEYFSTHNAIGNGNYEAVEDTLPCPVIADHVVLRPEDGRRILQTETTNTMPRLCTLRMRLLARLTTLIKRRLSETTTLNS
jgi:hypothetical protein